jgi:hypothetical protein
MQLIAALVPPREAVDHALGALAGALAAEPAPAASPLETASPRRRQLFRSRRPGVQATVAPSPRIDLLDADRVHVPLVKFGNLAITDVHRLVAALERSAPAWPAPRLRLSGGATQGWPEDRHFVMGVTGETDAVDEIVRSIARAAQEQQLFVDRRIFRSRVALGVVEEPSGPELDELASALGGYEGREWQQRSISVLTPADRGLGGSGFRSVAELQVGTARN